MTTHNKRTHYAANQPTQDGDSQYPGDRLLILGTQYAGMIIPNLKLILSVVVPHFLQEIGNLLPILIAIPPAVKFGFGRRAIGACSSISREPSVAAIRSRGSATTCTRTPTTWMTAYSLGPNSSSIWRPGQPDHRGQGDRCPPAFIPLPPGRRLPADWGPDLYQSDDQTRLIRLPINRREAHGLSFLSLSFRAAARTGATTRAGSPG